MSNSDSKQLARLLGVRVSDGEMTTDELIALLAQVVLALLIIFVMANVLFMAKANADINSVKKGWEKAQEELDRIKQTPPGIHVKKREDALINLQRQRLLLAVEKVEAIDRDVYGPGIFMSRDDEGKTRYLLGRIVSGGEIVNDDFKRSCRAAKENLPHGDDLRKNWLDRVRLASGMSIEGSSVELSIIDNPENITKGNAEWLISEIDRRVQKMYDECCDLQREALSKLFIYYSKHADSLKGSEVHSLVVEYSSAPLEKKNRLIDEINDGLQEHSKSVFEKNGVPLLNDI